MEQLFAIFIDEHVKINNLINEIINENNSLNRRNSLKKQLYLLLKKHFDEEELLYKKYRFEIQNVIMTLQRMYKEHEFLITKMNDADTNFHELYKFLKIHEHIEEKVLYPELARSVSSEDISSVMRVVVG